MSRRVKENLMVLAFLAIFIAVIVMSLDFGPRARMIPLPLASFGVILALVQLVWQNFGSTDALKMDMIRVDEPKIARPGPEEQTAKSERKSEREPTAARRASAYAIVVGLVLMILAFGPLPAVFVFTLGYFLVTRYYTPVMAFLYTSLLTGAIYLLFFVLLEINPYHGLLAPLMAHFD